MGCPCSVCRKSFGFSQSVCLSQMEKRVSPLFQAFFPLQARLFLNQAAVFRHSHFIDQQYTRRAGGERGEILRRMPPLFLLLFLESVPIPAKSGGAVYKGALKRHHLPQQTRDGFPDGQFLCVCDLKRTTNENQSACFGGAECGFAPKASG